MVCYFAHSEQSLKGLRSLCVIMLCFKRQLWFQNTIWVSGRWRVGGWGWGRGWFRQVLDIGH